jgi:hypothetical protein
VDRRSVPNGTARLTAREVVHAPPARRTGCISTPGRHALDRHGPQLPGERFGRGREHEGQGCMPAPHSSRQTAPARSTSRRKRRGLGRCRVSGCWIWYRPVRPGVWGLGTDVRAASILRRAIRVSRIYAHREFNVMTSEPGVVVRSSLPRWRPSKVPDATSATLAALRPPLTATTDAGDAHAHTAGRTTAPLERTVYLETTAAATRRPAIALVVGRALELWQALLPTVLRHDGGPGRRRGVLRTGFHRVSRRTRRSPNVTLVSPPSPRSALHPILEGSSAYLPM